MPQLGQPGQIGTVSKSAPGRDTVLDRLEALEKFCKGLTVAQSITYTAVNAVPLGTPPGTIANQTTSLDTNPIKVWQAAAETDTLFAVGLTGDAFPRLVCFADPENGIWFGDGSFDPTAGANIFYDASDEGALVLAGGDNGGTSVGMRVNTNQGNVFDNNGGLGVIVFAPLCLNGLATVNSFSGDPNGHVGGNLNDACIVSDGSTSGPWIYRCTTAGDASTAVWTVAVST